MSSANYNPYGQAPPPGYPPHAYMPPPPPPKKGRPVWVWILLLIVGFIVLSCAGLIGLTVYVGAVGPETKVYAGNEVPKRFIDTATELKLLDPGETVKFFYSDALTDVRNGMYFVTDRKVVIYIADAAKPSTIVPFKDIEDAELVSGTSWLEDGSITLRLKDGSVVVFPVSVEEKRDKLMFEAIPVKRASEDADDDTAVEK